MKKRHLPRRKPTSKWLGAVKPQSTHHWLSVLEDDFSWSVDGMDRLMKDLLESDVFNNDAASEQEVVDFLFGSRPDHSKQPNDTHQLVIAIEDLDELLTKSPAEIFGPILTKIPQSERASVEDELMGLLQDLAAQHNAQEPHPLSQDSIGRALERRRQDPSVTVVSGPSTRH